MARGASAAAAAAAGAGGIPTAPSRKLEPTDAQASFKEARRPLSADNDEDEETNSEPAPEVPSEHREARPGSPPAAAGENGGKRRRRRRGRRGRRRDGETVGGESPAQTPFQPEPASFAASPAIEEHPVMIPNAPSSPLWSLADQTDHRPSLPERAALAIHEEPKTTVSAAAEIEPRTNAEDTRAPAPEHSEDVDATPHEARKGWWQRRFKI